MSYKFTIPTTAIAVAFMVAFVPLAEAKKNCPKGTRETPDPWHFGQTYCAGSGKPNRTTNTTQQPGGAKDMNSIQPVRQK
jgi:hypothetical protein